MSKQQLEYFGISLHTFESHPHIFLVHVNTQEVYVHTIRIFVRPFGIGFYITEFDFSRSYLYFLVGIEFAL